MEAVLKEIECGWEAGVRATLTDFIDKNKANFSLGEETATRRKFCSSLLHSLANTDSPGSWSQETKALALTALRIFAREREATESLTCTAGLRPIVELAELHSDVKESCFASGNPVPCGKVQVLVEAVKCLCNILLNNQHLVPTCTDLGCLCGLTLRLALCRSMQLPHDVVFFDLRLLFLITACGVTERQRLRDDLMGIPLLINLIDSTLFGRRELAPHHTQHHFGASNEASLSKVQSSRTGGTTSKVSRDPHGVEVNEKALEDGCELEAKTKVLGNHDMEELSNEHTDGIQRKGSESIRYFPSCLPPLRDTVYCLSAVLDDGQFTVLSEVLKILFNQTVHWHEDADYDDEEIVLYTHITHLIRILLVSVPVSQSKAAAQMIVHCTEVLVNIPQKCAHAMLLPPHIQVMPTLRRIHPSTYPPWTPPSATAVCSNKDERERDANSDLYIPDLDRVFDDWNMAVIIALLNFLHFKLGAKIEYHGLSPILSALRVLSRGHRSIRRLLKSEILPPLHEIRQRPEQGDSLKSRIVRLMTAGTHGAEEVTAELLFVLCKESASRLIKHTGYGNAAGLLLSRGLLGGGRSKGEDEYSTDSETSDTEEYECSKPHIDPVTGGPSKEGLGSPLDHMTEEEKEAEAEKLHKLFEKLDQHGIIKVLPLDQYQRPLPTRDESSNSEDETD